MDEDTTYVGMDVHKRTIDATLERRDPVENSEIRLDEAGGEARVVVAKGERHLAGEASVVATAPSTPA
jgi:hypothetical protein